MTESTKVQIKPAKGRPMLTWVGKKPLRQVSAYPAQMVEKFSAEKGDADPRPAAWEDWPKEVPQAGLLFHGDNKDVLAWLLANGFRGKVKLIYIDPPFDSGADYVRRVELRGGKVTKLVGEAYSIGEQIQYTDIWTNDNYLQFIYERLLLLKELLSGDGSLFLHCDDRKGHFLRCLMEEVFGSENFRGQIGWQRSTPKGNMTKGLGSAYDTILYFSKSDGYIWNQQFLEHSPEYVEKYYTQIEEGTGRKYQLTSLLSPATDRPNLTYEFQGHTRVWRYTRERMYELEKRGRVIVPKEDGMPREKRYLDEMKGIALQDLWTDISPVNSQATERADYPTQKPETLIERILKLSTIRGDLVLDCFLGSGTTAAVAQKHGRRWIGADINRGAIQTTIKRLQGVIQEQLEDARGKTKTLPGMEGEEELSPAQSAFVVYRVNDYDLQIQHNEAFNLAVEHLGMTRLKTDAYFDGTLGKKLVKIVPFNHPITALDLEEVKQALGTRPEEERDIVVVGLGKELAVDAWLEDWNKLRKQGSLPNKIEVIELRTDPKYGGFFTHEPASAKISFKRQEKGVEVTIDDFISPTILERLQQQNKDNPLFQPQIEDWRSMVDSVMIDADYNGEVFNITLADVPEKKSDLVEGKYLVEAKKSATIAVKVTDMLGEEVIKVQKV